MYASDSARSTDGAFACKQLSEVREAVGSWISLEPTEVTLPAFGNTVIPFTITIPPNIGVGEHNGCILIQQVKKVGDTQKAGANISVRTGLRVALTVEGEIDRSVEIEELNVELTERDTYVVHPSIKNSGNVSVDIEIGLKTKSFLGYMIKESKGEYPVLRGETSEWNFESKKPFFGGWNFVTMEVRYSTEGNAEVKDQVLEHPTTVFFSSPTVPGLIIEIVLILILMYLVFRYRALRKKRAWIKNSWKKHVILPGENINDLAEKRGIKWERVAEVNKILPPYTLKAGGTIILPPRINLDKK